MKETKSLKTNKTSKYYKYKRIPVVYKGTPLMPMCRKRVKKFLKEGKGILVKTKNLGVYLKLKVEPSGYEVQEVSLGIDPGTMFTGYSIVTLKYCNANYQRNTLRVKQIQRRSSERSSYRRIRRTRLRHRKIRFKWRTGTKLSKTCQYYLQVKLQMIKDLMKIYPISTICTEDIRYNHYVSTKGRSFSNIEVGKNKFRRAIMSLELNLIEVSGYDTKELRSYYLKYDRKCSDKSERNFYAHCFDSFVIANVSIGTYKTWINRDLIIIEEHERSRRSRRRQLMEFSSQGRNYEYEYYRLGPKGKKNYFTRYSKLKKVRVKISEDQGNHGPWEYLYTNKSPTKRARNLVRYGYTKNKELGPKVNNGQRYYDNYLNKIKVPYYN